MLINIIYLATLIRIFLVHAALIHAFSLRSVFLIFFENDQYFLLEDMASIFLRTNQFFCRHLSGPSFIFVFCFLYLGICHHICYYYLPHNSKLDKLIQKKSVSSYHFFFWKKKFVVDLNFQHTTLYVSDYFQFIFKIITNYIPSIYFQYNI